MQAPNLKNHLWGFQGMQLVMDFGCGGNTGVAQIGGAKFHSRPFVAKWALAHLYFRDSVAIAGFSCEKASRLSARALILRAKRM